MNAETIVAIAAAATFLVTVFGGIGLWALTMWVDHRIRTQITPALDAIRHTQGENGAAIGRLAVKIDNGVSDRLDAVDKALRLITRHLLEDD